MPDGIRRGAPGAWPRCVPGHVSEGCGCAARYMERTVIPAAGGRLLVSPPALRPGDVYLVVRPGRIAEATITSLRVPPHHPNCRWGERVTEGTQGTFWIDPGYVTVIRRDPAQEGQPAQPSAPPHLPPPADALMYAPHRVCAAFTDGRHYETGTSRTRDGRPGWAVRHAEDRTGSGGGWDNFGRRPGTGPAYLPYLTVACTACVTEDLGQPGDDEGPGGYMCRLGHVHRGPSPYGRELPPEVAARISVSLGEKASRAADRVVSGSRDS